MVNVSVGVLPNVTSSGTGQKAQNTTKTQDAGVASFDDLMAQATVKANASVGVAGQFLDSLTRAVQGKSGASQASSSSVFPFSDTFESVFGTSGPLIDFINITTTRLHLSAEQHQALQNIAINNKDITNTPANVQKIVAELKEAGIG